jgi:segregation and condensation protein B
MKDVDVLPELKQIVGAMLFAAKHPLSPSDVVACLRTVAEEQGGAARDFAQLKEADIRTALEDLRVQLDGARLGFAVAEVAGGFRLENHPSCGLWLRQLLAKGRPNRLSKPALETLAVIAYRQPCTRAEIEAVRGVAVDQIVRNLMEMQLIRIVGRSELPGRPWQFGTTGKFLEYFGLNDVKELPGVEELRRIVAEKQKKDDEPSEPVFEEEQGPAAKQDEGSSEKADENEDEVEDEDEEEDEEEAEDDEDDDEDEEEEEEEDEDEEEPGK